MYLSENIMYLRKKENFSQKDLSDKLLVSEETIEGWEKNVELPNVNELVKLSKLFTVSIDKLVFSNLCDHRSPLRKTKKLPLISKMMLSISGFLIILTCINIIITYYLLNDYTSTIAYMLYRYIAVEEFTFYPENHITLFITLGIFFLLGAGLLLAGLKSKESNK